MLTFMLGSTDVKRGDACILAERIVMERHQLIVATNCAVQVLKSRPLSIACLYALPVHYAISELPATVAASSSDKASFV